ncbi:hypothetical protein OAS54_04410 [Gammaproteobacteria bacterium]|nr:hypothetical protein [Gammaproteobacteria bacterium]MDC0902618.1 hypothetical protein [Gammaproteobacteria bacterium]
MNKQAAEKSMHAFNIYKTPKTNNAKKKATTPIANQKYNSFVLPKRYAFIARPQQYNGASVMIIELINIAIGIKAKTKNN